MPRCLLLLLLLALPSCQNPPPSQTEPAPASDTFDHDTAQTYDIQTREYEQHPPFGPRSDRSQ